MVHQYISHGPNGTVRAQIIYRHGPQLNQGYNAQQPQNEAHSSQQQSPTEGTQLGGQSPQMRMNDFEMHQDRFGEQQHQERWVPIQDTLYSVNPQVQINNNRRTNNVNS